MSTLRGVEVYLSFFTLTVILLKCDTTVWVWSHLGQLLLTHSTLHFEHVWVFKFNTCHVQAPSIVKNRSTSVPLNLTHIVYRRQWSWKQHTCFGVHFLKFMEWVSKHPIRTHWFLKRTMVVFLTQFKAPVAELYIHLNWDSDPEHGAHSHWHPCKIQKYHRLKLTTTTGGFLTVVAQGPCGYFVKG